MDTEAAKEARKASKTQSDRLSHIDSRVQDWVGISTASCALVFTWTGRIGVNLAYCRAFGRRFAQLPAGISDKLMVLIKRIADSSHPGHADAIKLVGQVDDRDTEPLDEDTAPGFFQHLVEENIILPMQVPQMETALAEYRQQAAGSMGKKQTAKKHQAAGKKSSFHARAPLEGKENALPPGVPAVAQLGGGATHMEAAMQDQLLGGMGGGAAHMEAAMQDQLLRGMGGGASHMETAMHDQLLGGMGDGQQDELLAAFDGALQLMGMAGPQSPVRKYRSRPRTKQPRFGETLLFPLILCCILTQKYFADPGVGADGASEEEEEQNQPKPKRGRRPGAYSGIIGHYLA